MEKLKLYQSEEEYYPAGIDDYYHFYLSTNFIWNPDCCMEKGVQGIDAETAYEMILHYKHI